MELVLVTYRARERVQLESWNLGPWTSHCPNFIIHLCRNDNHNCRLPKSQGVLWVWGQGHGCGSLVLL